MIIRSLLDTDLYKFTMMQAVLHRFPAAEAEYRFICRTPGVDLRPLAPRIREELQALAALRFSDDELAYLGGLRFIRRDFVEFLRLFHLQERFVSIDASGPDLQLVIRGPWLHTILFEVPLLAIVNELHFAAAHPGLDLGEGRRRLAQKIELVRATPAAAGFVFADFGTRRRFSAAWQREVVTELVRALPQNCRGSSNVLLAKELGITPIGTMAHEFLQAAQALGPRLADAQRFAFDTWAREYRGDLGIALSDTYGLDAFLRDFDLYFLKLFDGARQDSGDPFEWAERVIAHYRAHRIDPRTKNLVFSDGLTMAKALAIFQRFAQDARLSFGIGTHLTNDVGPQALNIVIKMTECDGQPVAKLSDEPGKVMCKDQGYLAYLRQVYQVTAKGVA